MTDIFDDIIDEISEALNSAVQSYTHDQIPGWTMVNLGLFHLVNSKARGCGCGDCHFCATYKYWGIK